MLSTGEYKDSSKTATINKTGRQAEREGGRILILPSEGSEEAGGLSSLTPDLASEGKDKESPAEKQAEGGKSAENGRNSGKQAEIEVAEGEVNTNPTDGQKEAGNYKKGHVQVGTFDITIEQPKGSVRRGTDANGKRWESKMHNTYGYIRGTEGVDGDHIDVFLSTDIDGWDGRKVFVIDQYNPDGTFDEHKVMLGFNEQDEAYGDYLANYEKGWEKGRKLVVTPVALEDFEKWIESSHRKTKPFAEYKNVQATDKPDIVHGQHNNFGYRIMVEDSVFPSGVIPESVITKKQKGGKRSNAENVSVVMVDGDLYVKRHVVNDSRRNVSIRIPNAKNFRANEIIYRLGLGIGTSEDAVRLMGDAILELYKKKSFRFEKATDISSVSSNEKALRDAVAQRLRSAGIEVIDDVEVGQKVLDEANEAEVRMSAKKKRALETASLGTSPRSLTVVSSAETALPKGSPSFKGTAISNDGANILNNLDTLANKLDENPNRQKTFIGDVAEALGIEAKDKSSKYATFEAKNGHIVTIRISNHNATVSNFDNLGEEEGISIVISRKKNNGIINDGNAHVVEYFYSDKAVAKAEGKPLAEIVRSIKQALYSGEFKDTTGLAERQEVNVPETLRMNARRRSKEAEKRLDTLHAIDEAVSFVTGRPLNEVKAKRQADERRIKAEAKELYEKVLAGNFNDVTLRLLNNYLDHVTPNNPYGRPLSKRLPQEVLRRMAGAARANEVDALFSRICEGSVGTSGKAVARDGAGRVVEKKNELLKKWAIATGHWHTDLSDFTDDKAPIGKGKDSDVYMSKDGKSVIKVSKGKDKSLRFAPDIDAVALFNYVFPYSQYDILGYGEIDGKFVKFLRQPFVDFSQTAALSVEERTAYMSNLGFKPINAEHTAFSNGTLVVADLQKGNIVRDKDGNVRVIDADVKLHTKDVGGNYSYPPVETDTELPDNKVREHRVYHGSGADFDRFDHSHMGEGEGMQAYGWGSYVTEVEGIGRTYARQNAKKQLTFKGTPVINQKTLQDGRIVSTPERAAYDAIMQEGTVSKAKQFISRIKDMAEEDIMKEFWNEVLNVLSNSKKSDFKITDRRILYTVEIPDDTGENYLDWDKPLPKTIDKEQLAKIVASQTHPEDDVESEMLERDIADSIEEASTGEGLYKAISLYVGYKKASGILSELGFTGIKYPAQYQSGGREDGAKNYVIFNEDDLKIVDHVRFFRSAEGEAYGFTVGGKIYIDPRIATPETPIHEYAHLWASALRQANPEEWRNVVGMMKDTPVWNKVKKLYPELQTDDEIADEVLATYSGRRGAERLREETRKAAQGNGSVMDKAAAVSAIERVKEALRRFWKATADFLHIHYTTAEEVADRVMRDLLEGVNPLQTAKENRLKEVNERFNEQLDGLTEANADNVILSLGSPSAVLRAAGVVDKPMKLYGNKVIKKMKKHGFSLEELHDLPMAVANPIAVFDNYHQDGNRSILTEMKIGDKNVLVSITVGKGNDVDFNIVSSLFGKGQSNIIDWINKGYATYIDKKKTLDYLHFSERSISEASSDREKALSYLHHSALRAEALSSPRLDSAANIVRNFRNPQVSEGNFRDGSGESVGNVPNAADEGRMVERVRELSERLNLGNVEIVADASTLDGKRRKAKGFYNKRTGKITIVVPNHGSVEDIEQTLLHEAVAHYGLRRLFGGRFNEFLDKVYINADTSIRKEIAAMAARRGWDFRTATEEYLAGLAERTDFENAKKSGWWQKVKRMFAEMLESLGFGGMRLSDGELRYVLWRSYENLKDGGRGGILGEAADVAKQYELKVGNYAELTKNASLEEVNARFNEELDGLTEENADGKVLSLGRPSVVLRSAGVVDKPMKLYGNKVMKKMRKHGFALEELRNLPNAVAAPIAVFDNYNDKRNRSILTELRTTQGNFLVTITIGKDADVDFNIVTSVFGKRDESIVDWFNKGYATYINKEKALAFLSHQSAPIAATAANAELNSAAKVVENFENPNTEGENQSESSVLDKIKNSKPIEITGREVKPSDDLKQYKKNALEYGKQLRGEYVNKDTGESVFLGKNAIKEVLNHDYKNPEQLQSIAAIPQIIEESIYVTSKANTDDKVDAEKFDYYVCGLKIGEVDYTVRAVFVTPRDGTRYYDHKLTRIEKGKLIDSLFGTTPGFNQTTSLDNSGKDKKLLAILQEKVRETTEDLGENQSDDILFRDGDDVEYEKALARDTFERRMRSGLYQMQEALQDSMLSLKVAMEAIYKAEGRKNMRIEDVAGFENAYLGENRLSSVDKAECDAFANLLFKPLLKAASKLAKTADQRAELIDYMMAKHGLERNELMRRREKDKLIEEAMKGKKPKEPKPDEEDYDDKMAAYVKEMEELREKAEAELGDKLDGLEKRDFAGLTALTQLDDVDAAEAEAARMVEDYEAAHDTGELWKRVKAVTDATLSKSYECGLMSKEMYEYVKSMYNHYIPLRGFEKTTAEQVYAYLPQREAGFNPPIKAARGRKSKADDPFASMEAMAESAIMQGNRNALVKQMFLNFALNHPSDLVSVSRLWLKYDDVAGEWKPALPDNIEETDSAAEVERKTQEFEKKMQQLAKAEPDKYKSGKEAAKMPYRVAEKRDERQHQVIVKRGGMDYVLTVNGNPRLAQALNGLTNPDNDASGTIGTIMKGVEKVNRGLSALYTTKNPDFIVSNFMRDMLYTNTMVWVKESPKYAARFHVNVMAVNPVRMKVLFAKHRNGKLDMENETERMFHQFMMNGGETGYANIRDIEKRKSDLKRELKKYAGRMPVGKAWDLLGEQFDELNRSVENCARFAAFMTSRQMGRSIDRSVWDAKDISVNFNKKGSGAKFLGANGKARGAETHPMEQNFVPWEQKFVPYVQKFVQGSVNTVVFASGAGRHLYVFWNAAIQGTTNFGRQAARHPAKAFTAMASMFLLGSLMAAIGGGDDGDDDGKDSYYNLPEYVRRSNIIFRAGDQWVSIPLPVEYRAVYGMGEMMTSVMSGKQKLSDGELASQIAAQMSQVMPIDIMETASFSAEGKGWRERGLNVGVSLAPSALRPIGEAFVNRSWTGLPIYKDTPWNKNAPEWTKAYSGANKQLVALSAALNERTGGDKYSGGAADINPAVVEHLLKGYFGGVASTVDKLVKMGETAVGTRDYNPRDFLILNRVVKKGDERTEYRALNDNFADYMDRFDKMHSRYSAIRGDMSLPIGKKIDMLGEFARDEEFRLLYVADKDFQKGRQALDAYREMGDEQKAKEMEGRLLELKRRTVNEMERIDGKR